MRETIKLEEYGTKRHECYGMYRKIKRNSPEKCVPCSHILDCREKEYKLRRRRYLAENVGAY